MVLLSFLLSTFAAGAPVTSEELIKLGEALAQRGDGKKAIVQLDKALADAALTDAQKARAERAYGLALLEEKKPKDAALHLEKSAALDAKVEKTYQLLGMAYDSAEQYAEAIAAYKKGVAAVPKSVALQHELGMALLQAGKNDEGASVLVAATKLAEQDPELRTDTAYALVLVGKFKEAKEEATLAVSLAPESADAYFNLGLAHAGLGDKKAAKTALTRALECDELHTPSLLQLGQLEQQSNNDAAAVKLFLRVLQVEPDDARAKEGLGLSLGRLGTDDKKAKELLLFATRVDPKNPMAWALLGDVYERDGKLDDALKAYDQTKKLRPDDAKVKARIDELKAKKKAAPTTPPK